MNLFFCFCGGFICDWRKGVSDWVVVFLYFVSMSSSVGLDGCSVPSSHSVIVFIWRGLVSTSG